MNLKNSPQAQRLTNADIVRKVAANQWWPFDRVDGKLLDKIDRQKKAANKQPAPEALI